VTVMMI